MTIDPGFLSGDTLGGGLMDPQKQTSSFRWATVTSTDPLRIRLDQTPDELDATPSTLIANLSVDDRVWCQIVGKRIIILGAPNGSGSGTLEPEIGGSISNATYYEKYPDGRLVCMGTYVFPGMANTEQSFVWQFPIEFVEVKPHVTAIGESTVPQNFSLGLLDHNYHATKIRFYRTTGSTTTVHFRADGRWRDVDPEAPGGGGSGGGGEGPSGPVTWGSVTGKPSTFAPITASGAEVEAESDDTKAVTPLSLGSHVAKIPDWESGKSYKKDMLVTHGDKVWRANKETTATPGPEVFAPDISDQNFWQAYESNTLYPVEPGGTVVVGSGTTWTYGVLLGGEFPESALHDGWVMDMQYRANQTSRTDNQIGIYAYPGSSPHGWGNSNARGVNTKSDAQPATGTSGTWAQGRLTLVTEGVDLRVEFFKDGTKVYSGLQAGWAGPFRPRFRSYGNNNGVLEVRDISFPNGPDNADWDEIAELGATRRYNGLVGKPTSFPASPHKHPASDIDSGTFAPARLPAATETAIGAVERATNAEAVAGTDTTRYVSPAGVKAATANKVENSKGVSAIWTGTQAEYDAIVTKSETTLYVITG